MIDLIIIKSNTVVINEDKHVVIGLKKGIDEQPTAGMWVYPHTLGSSCYQVFKV